LTTDKLTETIHRYVKELCVNITDRSPGAPGNRQATDFFDKTISSFGFKTACPDFDCIDWEHGSVNLKAGKDMFEAYVSPYTLGYSGTATLAAASTVEELTQSEIGGKILLIHGQIASQQLMPKNFPFYNPDEHKKIISLLEEKAPAAIICATGKDPELVGAMYPFPLIEDGDFDIPSVYMKDVHGECLLAHAGTEITLDFMSKRIESKGCNVIATKGPQDARKLIFCAHIDSRKYTPGALDNAAGVATLLALAELLADYKGPLGLEIIAFNGEDYYAASGQIQYLAANQATLKDIKLVINIDDAGYHDGKTAYSLYQCPETMAQLICNTLGNREELIEGQPWYQGDHMIFVQQQIPALAVTSEQMGEALANITHTPKDTIDLVNCGKLAELACGLKDMVSELTKSVK